MQPQTVGPKQQSYRIIQLIDQKQWIKAYKACSKLIKDDCKYIPQFNSIASKLAQAWIQNQTDQKFLDFFDCFLLKIQRKQDRDFYKNVILNMTYYIFKFIKEQIDNQESLIIWTKYIEILRSFTFRSLNFGLDETNWFFYSLIISILMQNLQMKNNKENKVEIYRCNQIIYCVNQVRKKKNLIKFCKQIQNMLFLLLRTYIADANSFLNQDSIWFTETSEFNSVNHCSLMMKVILDQINTSSIENDKKYQTENFQKRLNCLILLITCLEIKQPKYENYSKMLQFCMGIIQFIQEQQSCFNQTYFAYLKFYSGQLLSLMCYKNIEWIVKISRQMKIIKIEYALKNNLDQIDDSHVCIKRLTLGFCGMIGVNSMQTQFQQIIVQAFPSLIKLIQKQHEQDRQLLNYDNDDQNQSSTQQMNSQKSKQEQGIERQKYRVSWDQCYFQKHCIESFDKIDEIQVMKQSFRSLKHRNPELLSILLQNFQENSVIMWLIELESNQEDDTS